MTHDMTALEFYADPFAWKKKHDPDNDIQVPDFYEELSFGDVAKQAIATKSEGNGQDASVKCAATGVHPTDTSCKAEPEVAPGPSGAHARDCDKQGETTDADHTPHSFEEAGGNTCRYCGNVKDHPVHSDRTADVTCEACSGTGRHMGRFSMNDPDCTYCRGKGKVRP